MNNNDMESIIEGVIHRTEGDIEEESIQENTEEQTEKREYTTAEKVEALVTFIGILIKNIIIIAICGCILYGLFKLFLIIALLIKTIVAGQ